jgi:hypothetical protein
MNFVFYAAALLVMDKPTLGWKRPLKNKERQQLTCTTADIFRLVPVAVVLKL